MPRRIITALDLEIIAQKGERELLLGSEDVVTDVARERALQLGIRFFEAPSAKELPGLEKGGRGIAAAINNSAVILPSGEDVSSTDQLELLWKELEQLKKEMAGVKAGKGNTAGRAVLTEARFPVLQADLVIKNGKLVLPRLGIIRADLEIVGRKIAAISINGQAKGKKTIDATGLYVLPGVIDPHTHLGVFGDLQEEIEKETASALLGGVTAAGCFLYSEASYFNYLPSFVELVERYSFVDIFPHLIITTPEQVEEIPAYIEELKITSFKIYMCGIPGLIPSMSDDRILDVFEKVKNYPHVSIAIHAENPHIVERYSARYRLQVEQENDLLAWSKTRPSLAEQEAVKRAILLAQSYGVTLYLVHLSAKESLEIIRDVKQKRGGCCIFAETTSPYLMVDTGWNLGAVGKMIPPFRPPEHREKLWEALREGIIDTVGTDNATLTLKEKKVDQGMGGALPGYPALATHLPTLLHEGVNGGRIDIARLAEVTSLRPAEIFGLYPAKGSLLPGSDADIVIVDLRERRTVDPLKLASRSDFSLYTGKELTGWPVFTVKSGEVVAQAGELAAAAKRKGMVIRRAAPTSMPLKYKKG